MILTVSYNPSRSTNTFCDGFNVVFLFLDINKKYKNAYQNLSLCHIIVNHSIIVSKTVQFLLKSCTHTHKISEK